MSKSEHHIDKLTPELIEKYHGGKLSESEAYQVERLMLNSDFDSEAMEGFENYSGDIANDLNQLNSQLEKRIAEEKNDNQFFWIKIAASILILALSSYLIWDLAQSESLKPLNVADNEVNESKLEEASSLAIDSVEEKQRVEDIPAIAQNKPQPSQKPEKIALPQAEVAEEIPTNNEESIAGSGASAAEALAYEPEEDFDSFMADEEIAEEVVKSEVRSEESRETAAKKISSEPIQSTDVSRRNTAKKSKLEAASPSAINDINSYTATVKGKVTSAEDGSPLPGVNVVLKGTTNGTVTDLEGNYKIDVNPSDKNTLVYSFIGLASEEVSLGSKTELNIRMQADVQQLSEVVVTRSNTDNLGGIYKFAQPVIGMNAYKKYLTENINYPDDKEVEAGKVIVTFDVKEDGSLDNYQIKRGLTEWHNNEALRLVKEGPAWEPSTNDGVPETGNVKVVVKFRP
ncbi:carboxypeptidase-like regulatory domain-containing protein [Fulvivirga lutea]|uniref:Carboxypeptidase-like regulatory domain-containing protein n=1 Tax=Fulvivirga lutea TaxID=2810512 RepID=A0A974WIH0_9BACT|nr:carboxypeptidase-like regulatory domain-containing protein [Fulvivirga lutea]QSE97822.1 carboxypeptidase-like regulatory domain-containing protein [Fulvivirga lutea]